MEEVIAANSANAATTVNGWWMSAAETADSGSWPMSVVRYSSQTPERTSPKSAIAMRTAP
jgi:hypothetical protein